MFTIRNLKLRFICKQGNCFVNKGFVCKDFVFKKFQMMEFRPVKESVPILENVDKKFFLENVYCKRVPVVLRGIDIGPCSVKWDAEYLASVLGTQEATVHVSEHNLMDFVNKNFLYRTLPLNELIKRASENEHKEFFVNKTEFYYLRTIGKNPRKDVANIQTQFPILARDVLWPSIVPCEKIFSSVFRIASASVILWTHYDIMDNMLIQVKGRKRAVLFPPENASKLYLNGDKSQVLDIDNPDLSKFPKFAKVNWHEVLLEEGDVLFIPALWFHNMKALDFGIAINVFWKNLPDELYDKKDPYGNKDLLPAQRAFASMNKLLASLNDLPETYQQFYCQRLIQQIKTKQKRKHSCK